ncbi:MAG: energy-coupling factor transporter transmembrane component T [Clostridia bacterium]|nr:energy-coupling factor transporter transmembrane component T [Clostridia bacterium]
MKNMCFGKFCKANSIIHSLDIRVKIMLTLFWIILALVATTTLSYVAIFTYTIFVLFLSKVPLKAFLKSIKPVIFIVIISGIINLFLTHQGVVLWECNFIIVTDYAVTLALTGMFKLLALGTFTAFLTLTSTPLDISHGIESLLSPLKNIIPHTKDFALAVGISISMVPVLYDEAKRLKISMLARGVDFKQKNFFTRTKSYIPLLIPLIVNSLNRSDELSLAIYMRGYSNNVDIKNEYIALKSSDFMAILISIVSAYLILQNLWVLLAFFVPILLFLVLNVCKVL